MNMNKTSSAKKAAKPARKDQVEQEKFTSKPKKMGSEIDDIFAGKKRMKPEKGKSETKKLTKESVAKAEQHNEMKMKKKRRIPEENLFAETPSGPRRKSGDGLTVYTEEELGIGKPDAGGTRLCPFDCNCCF